MRLITEGMPGCNTERVSSMGNRVSALGTQDKLPGSSRKGGRKYGGRKPGTSNKLTQELKDAVIEAAERVGSDEKGKDGLIGYLMRVGRMDSKAFGSLLRAVLPLRIDLEAEIKGEEPLTLEDCRAYFSKMRMPMPFWLPAYFSGELALGRTARKRAFTRNQATAVKLTADADPAFLGTAVSPQPVEPK
jgi:hypothetical protein